MLNKHLPTGTRYCTLCGIEYKPTGWAQKMCVPCRERQSGKKVIANHTLKAGFIPLEYGDDPKDFGVSDWIDTTVSRCEHCNKELPGGIVEWSDHVLHCEKNTDGLIIAKTDFERKILDSWSINKKGEQDATNKPNKI